MRITSSKFIEIVRLYRLEKVYCTVHYNFNTMTVCYCFDKNNYQLTIFADDIVSYECDNPIGSMSFVVPKLTGYCLDKATITFTKTEGSPFIRADVSRPTFFIQIKAEEFDVPVIDASQLTEGVPMGMYGECISAIRDMKALCTDTTANMIFEMNEDYWVVGTQSCSRYGRNSGGLIGQFDPSIFESVYDTSFRVCTVSDSKMIVYGKVLGMLVVVEAAYKKRSDYAGAIKNILQRQSVNLGDVYVNEGTFDILKNILRNSKHEKFMLILTQDDIKFQYSNNEINISTVGDEDTKRISAYINTKVISSIISMVKLKSKMLQYGDNLLCLQEMNGLQGLLIAVIQ